MITEMSFSPSKAGYYLITVEGKIDPSWSDWLGGLQLISRKEADGMYMTTICGTLTDQVALRGLLNHLWDLNLTLRSVKRIDPATQSEMD